MPERLVKTIMSWHEQLTQSLIFSLVGISIGLGQLLSSTEKLTARLIVGRSLATGGLSMAAGLALVLVPDLPLVAQIGAAAALASLGTSGLERMFQSFMNRKG